MCAQTCSLGACGELAPEDPSVSYSHGLPAAQVMGRHIPKGTWRPGEPEAPAGGREAAARQCAGCSGPPSIHPGSELSAKDSLGLSLHRAARQPRDAGAPPASAPATLNQGTAAASWRHPWGSVQGSGADTHHENMALRLGTVPWKEGRGLPRTQSPKNIRSLSPGQLWEFSMGA